MTLAVNEKKQLLQAQNDKLRSKMAKDSFKSRAEQGASKTPYHKVLRDQVSVAAYAPDIVKWTEKDMRKIMQIDRDPNADD